MATEHGGGLAGGQLASPVAIDGNTTYVAAYLAPMVATTRIGMTSDAINAGAADNVATGGRYAYGTAAPTSTSTANYFVDPVFVYAPDSTPPKSVIDLSGDNATSVPVTRAGDLSPSTRRSSRSRPRSP